LEKAPPLSTRPRILLSGGSATFRLAPFEVISLLVLLAVAAFGGYTVYGKVSGANKTLAAPPIYIPAFRQTLTSSVSTTGTVQASQQVNLTFDINQNTAKITQFLVGLGDQVTQGQPLARLDDTELLQSVRSAQAGLDSAQARYNAVANPTADAIASAQQSIASATSQVTTAQNNLNNLLSAPLPADLLTAQQAVGTAQGNVTKAQNDVTTAKTNVTAAQNDVAAAKASLDSAYQAVIAALSQTWPASCAKPAVFQGQLAPTASCTTTTTVSATPTSSNNQSNSSSSSSSTSSSSTPSAVTSYNSAAGTYNTALGNFNSKQQALKTAQTNLTNGNLDQAVDNAQAGLATAQQKLSDTQAGAKPGDINAARNSVASAQAGLVSAQAKFNALMAPSPDVTLPLLASVETARDNLATAQQNLNNATIIAPFDGQISQLNGNIGTQVTSSTVVFILLNPKLVRIDANVDQADINNLKVGQVANVTFDALTGRSYVASVAAIGLTPTIQSGVVTYVVSFAIDSAALPAGTPVPAPGMTASLTVQTSRTENALVVPNRAIKRAGRGPATVSLKGANDQPEPKTVVTGVTNGTLTQITSGINDGDLVLVSAPSTSGASATPQGFGGGGGPVIIGGR
jgi:HlyD family secretion protein